MIAIKMTGLNELAESLKKKMLTIQDKNKVVRTIATSMCALMKERIHEDGLNSSNSKIGDYDPKYIKTRIKKGRGASRKVILSLSGQMENDFSIGITNPIPTQNGWGLGFKNEFNAEKSEWMVDKYGNIYKLTKDEEKKVKEIGELEVTKILKNK